MKLRRAVSAVMALALCLSATAFLGTRKLKASGEHKITISAVTCTQGGLFLDGKKAESAPVEVLGGKVELSQYTASEGEKIDVLIVPESLSEIAFVLVGNGASGEDISKKMSMDFEMPDEDVMIDVKFVMIQDFDYTVYFETAVGYGSMDAAVLPNEEAANAFILPEPTFDCPDSKFFVGWTIPEDENTYPVGATIQVPKEGLICCAKYVDFQTQAIFTPGDQGHGEMEPQTFTSKAEALAWKLPECEFDGNDGYCFDSWEVVGTFYKPGDPFSMYMQVDYFAFEAKWKPLENTCYVVAAGALNVREGASKETDRIGGMTYGKAFDATSEKITDGEKWVRLKYNGDDGVVDGFVMRKFLYLTYSVDTAIEPQKVKVTAGALDIRSTPEKLADLSNRIGEVTNGKEMLVTGYLDNGTPDDTSDDWLVLDFTLNDGTHTLGFAMAKYTEGVKVIDDIGTKSLDISGSIPTGYSLDPAAVIASENSANIGADHFGNDGSGLYTAVIYPADGYNFRELTKDNVTIPADFNLSIMDFGLNEDGSINLTLGPVNPVKISFVGSGTAELLARYVSEGNTITRPAEDPTLEGSTFTGWYEDEACTIEFDFSKPISGDISIFAGFALNESKSTDVQEQSEDTTETTVEEQNEEKTETIAEPQVSYTATCETPTVVRGSGKPFVVTVKRSVDDAELCFQMFRGALIDGKPLVQGQNYTAEKGSTIITVMNEAIEALSDGEHTITIEFADGKVEYKFKLAQPEAKTDNKASTETPTPTPAAKNSATPKTGDVGSNTRIVVIIAVALVGIAAVLLMDKRKKDEDE